MDNAKIEQIAKVCHEANRAYCQTLGDNSQPEWDRTPKWQRDSAINGVHFHISHLTIGQKPAPSASHEAWLEQKRKDGWIYGATKDADKKEHPCFVPYHALPLEQRMKDYIFASIVDAMFTANRVEVAA